ncbi:hypothetical protein AJ85_01665 [Alkalihalobacillus alcalophilus ATCC 27647 = CGMCC 1.3604]|uniref:Restriction endonuclease type IV Mrr domain-containing protein n=1 Tax=Alkalihalobacillus alcalophilus ATCC 27647 = CGMCC 1.3604 TaxID=1218173 RepID=A0A094WM41_ALKAL|nr:restriction endonuclease [Alkalihalobacillus alcalophilus]KGA98799.1 hypothetical protein BALCAV_0202535 [Alkalihalobacillus alcalophilus ATCC 27647 = CGMCC 1.3604]MED1560982.1 restriction endonuclease [Alkalihalobacillus alcalophilus]THG88647.1 hypothetical protein AJ85_01665 [Alkalihalobacillus alcalophilus ATCC 27647 = CGMCC 1.3604]
MAFEQQLLLILVLVLIATSIIWIVVRKLKKQKYDLMKITIRDIDRMSGHEFEDYLLVLFAAIGVGTIYQTKKSRDFGADMVFYNEENEKVVLQAKRYTDKLGLSAVQEIYAARAFYEAEKSIIVTSTDKISDPCYQLAAATQVGIIDREGLDELLKSFKKGKEDRARQLIVEATSGQNYQYIDTLERLETNKTTVKAGEYFYRKRG